MVEETQGSVFGWLVVVWKPVWKIVPAKYWSVCLSRLNLQVETPATIPFSSVLGVKRPVTGGPVNVGEGLGGCVGLANESPDVVLTYTDTEGSVEGVSGKPLRLLFEAEVVGDNSVLIINDPYGDWFWFYNPWSEHPTGSPDDGHRSFYLRHHHVDGQPGSWQRRASAAACRASDYDQPYRS